MQISDSILELSASDLSQFLSCRHLTALNLAVALGQRAAPTWIDPVLVVLQQRRLEHERAYVDTLRAEGVTVADLSMKEADDAVPASLNAMRTGVDIIIQPALRNGRWFGRPDVLRRTEIPSTLGPWSYEVLDTKLAIGDHAQWIQGTDGQIRSRRRCSSPFFPLGARSTGPFFFAALHFWT